MKKILIDCHEFVSKHTIEELNDFFVTFGCLNGGSPAAGS
jgi:hypothetical protein